VSEKKGRPACEGPRLKANVENQPAPYSTFASESQQENQSTPKPGGRKSRDRGNRVERALVRILQDHGFGDERVPLSGAAGGSYVGDVSIPLLGIDRTIEVKARADGFRELYKWLEGRDVLVVKADRREPLVVIPLRFAVDLARAAEKANRGGA